MKRIVFKTTLVYNEGAGEADRGVVSRTEFIAVFARSINSGFAKAVARANRARASYEDILSIEFSEVQ